MEQIPICNDINDINKLYKCFSKSGFCYIPIHNINFVNETYDIVKDYFNEDISFRLSHMMGKDGFGFYTEKQIQ